MFASDANLEPTGNSMAQEEAEPRAERRLVAILAADIAGYSRLMGIDEEGTLRALKGHRRALIDPGIAAHRGRIVKTTGDGMLVEFASAVDAVRCAVEVQRGMVARSAEMAGEERIEFRIGINVGDIIVEGGDIFGDGVNIAARLEALCEPGGLCISRAARDHIRDKLGFPFADLGEQNVKNIARPIRAFGLTAKAIAALPAESLPRSVISAEPTPTEARPLALPDKPSIAVLPFQNMSGDPEQEYFADGMVEEIITALSRIRWLFVIARNSSFTYKGKAVDVKQVGRELGVRYVLEGSVRKAGNRMRITGQLIDAISGAHLWADHFDGSLADVFELQDKVAISVAGVIEPALQAAEIRRSVERPTNDSTAYDLYLRALSYALTWGKQGLIQALDLLGKATERDPHYCPALVLAARCHQDLHVNGWGEDPEANHREGIDLARRALHGAGDDAFVLGNAGYVLAYFGEDISVAMELADRAPALNPSFARGWVISGWLRLWSGQPDPATIHFETSLRLSPRAGGGSAFVGIGVGHFFARRFEKARAILLQSLQEHPTWAPTHRFLASCYAHMGRFDEARDIVKRLRDVTPLVIPSAAHWRNPEDREFYLQGLRLAATEPG
ncbi:adenylate cyclase [Rhizobiales bacterium GAS113]|nr:adenylate cyclase [Rhizobiales bacterium GAS113]